MGYYAYFTEKQTEAWGTDLPRITPVRLWPRDSPILGPSSQLLSTSEEGHLESAQGMVGRNEGMEGEAFQAVGGYYKL